MRISFQTEGECSSQGLEAIAHLCDEELGLFPRREVTPLVELVVVNEFGICPLGPASRGGIDLVGEDTHGHRDGDVPP